MAEETKIIYHIDDEDTPYLVKIPVDPDKVTLGDFKNVLNRPSYKFFFKSEDDDFGTVKEEINDEDAHLPHCNGRVVSWLVSADNSTASDSNSQCAESNTPGEGRTALHLPHRSALGGGNDTETDSVISARRDHPRGPGHHRYNKTDRFREGYHRANGHRAAGGYRAGESGGSALGISDLETTSFLDSDEDELSSRVTTTTDETSVSRIHERRKQQKRRRQLRAQMADISRTSSLSSITDSTMSLNIITVTLPMDTVNFLGISIVGQSNRSGDGGIFVGSIMKGGAVALDGRIEPGDMILQVNDISFENLSNDEAVKVLREAVRKPGVPVKLVVAKAWDPSPKGYFTIPRTEPVRPIDPSAWVAHTAACQPDLPPDRPSSVNTVIEQPPRIMGLATSDCDTTSLLGRNNPAAPVAGPYSSHLSPHDMAGVVRAMAQPDSGLEIRDRQWLKITIPQAFIGSDVVDWLHSHVEGFQDRRESKKYAIQMLKAGYIKHTVNKNTFSEQCYYTFGDLSTILGFDSLRIGHAQSDTASSRLDSSSEEPQHMPHSAGYLPHPPMLPWGPNYNYSTGTAAPNFPPPTYQPLPSMIPVTVGGAHSMASGGSGGSGSSHHQTGHHPPLPPPRAGPTSSSPLAHGSFDPLMVSNGAGVPMDRLSMDSGGGPGSDTGCSVDTVTSNKPRPPLVDPEDFCDDVDYEFIDKGVI